LLFGVIGLAMGAFQWTVSPWFVSLKQAAATWLVEHDSYWLLQADAPWWLLTHYPQANDLFSWLDGLLILSYLAVSALLLGGGLWLLLRAAALLVSRTGNTFEHLALSLIPLGASGLFLGLSATTVKLLRYEGLALAWVQPARAGLLVAAIVWSLWLGWQVLGRHGARGLNRLAAFSCLALGSAGVGYGWWLQFWGWS
jgi:hypothetical protein